jgi:hypothetical protein
LVWLSFASGGDAELVMVAVLQVGINLLALPCFVFALRCFAFRTGKPAR